MTVANFFNKTIIIYRLKTRGSKQKFFATATADASVHKLADTLKGKLEGLSGRGRTYRAYFDLGVPIAVGDILKDKNSTNEYKIRSIQTMEMGINVHEVVTMERTDVVRTAL